MKRYTLCRLSHEQEQTLGYLFDGVNKLCCTLELEWAENQKEVSCIPPGVYKVVKRYSDKYKHHWIILDVPNRDHILIHHGNYHRDILGCILVGNNFVDLDKDGYRDVTSSKNTMKKLITILPQLFELEIK